jgi:hypothetical protein
MPLTLLIKVASAAKYFATIDRNSSESFRISEFFRLLNVTSHEKAEAFDSQLVTGHAITLSLVSLLHSLLLDTDVIAAFGKLQPNPMESLTSQNSVNPTVPGQRRVAQYLPVLPTEALDNVASLDSYATYYSETLLHDVLNVGSMLGASLIGQTAEYGADLITCLLNSGIAYVASSGKIMGLFNIERSMLYLGAGQSPWSHKDDEINRVVKVANKGANVVDTPYRMPASLLKRLKDMPRIFRNKVDPSKKLSLKLNSNFDEAVRKLRMHHGTDCWVDEHLEVVWRHMTLASPPRLLIFELWYGDDMIAADFGHCTDSCLAEAKDGDRDSFGRAIYIATRFFDRDGSTTSIADAGVRFLMPGFLLALAECNVLRKLGCLLWDLGGVDLCPLMQYKYDLTGESLQRPVALMGFRAIRDCQHSSVTQAVNGGLLVGADTTIRLQNMRDLRSGMVLIETIDFDALIN